MSINTIKGQELNIKMLKSLVMNCYPESGQSN